MVKIPSLKQSEISFEELRPELRAKIEDFVEKYHGEYSIDSSSSVAALSELMNKEMKKGKKVSKKYLKEAGEVVRALNAHIGHRLEKDKGPWASEGRAPRTHRWGKEIGEEGISKVGRMRTPEEAVERLLSGNERFVSGRLQTRNTTRERWDTKDQQRPFAVVVGCSDSRTAPETVFDVKLGEVFAVRNAGAVVGNEGLESIKYAVDRLGVKVVVVMGHEGCGAVTAAYEGKTQGITWITEKINPAVARVKKTGDRRKDIDECVECSVKDTVKALRKDPQIMALEEEGVLKVVGMIYSMETGKIKVVD